MLSKLKSIGLYSDTTIKLLCFYSYSIYFVTTQVTFKQIHIMKNFDTVSIPFECNVIFFVKNEINDTTCES